MPRMIESALTLTLPQLRMAVSRKLRENRAAGRLPRTRYQLAKSWKVKPNQIYMVLGGTKVSRGLRVRLQEWAEQ
jgi:hypothetical protein